VQDVEAAQGKIVQQFPEDGGQRFLGDFQRPAAGKRFLSPIPAQVGTSPEILNRALSLERGMTGLPKICKKEDVFSIRILAMQR
jgi:hypothetical protein